MNTKTKAKMRMTRARLKARSNIPTLGRRIKAAIPPIKDNEARAIPNHFKNIHRFYHDSWKE